MMIGQCVSYKFVPGISQGSVETHLRRGGMVTLLPSLSVKEF